MKNMEKSWIISFYSDNEQLLDDKNRENYKFLSWSSYDRIELTEVNTFKEMCQNGITQKKWNGVTQHLHLIPDECNMPDNVTFSWKTDESSIKMIDSHYGLYCLINLRFNQQILNCYNNYNFVNLASNLKKAFYLNLDSFISENKFDCEFYGFQSLSTEDVVLIILANDIVTFDKIIKHIRNINFEKNKKAFELISIFTGLNQTESHDVDPGMDLKIKLYLKSDITINDAILKFKEEYKKIIGEECKTDYELRILSGYEYLELLIPHTKKILSLFCEGNILNGESDVYKNYFKNSRTYWIEKKESCSYNADFQENCNKDFLKIGININSYSKDLNSTTNTINFNNNQIKNPVAQFIIDEYKRLIDSPRCITWKNIMISQCSIVSKLIIEYQEKNEKALCNLLNYVQTSLTFINQACFPVHEVPYNNYFYSGSYNDLLKMYYGIISQIITIGYSYEHDSNTNQHPLYFAVNFEATTNIHSIMYTLSSDNDRFIIFHLPYDDIYNYPKMIKYLIHEVYHYIAPYSRKNRMQNFLKLAYTQVLNIIIQNCFEKYDEYDNNEKNNLLILMGTELNNNIDKYIDFTIKCFEKNNIKLNNATLNDFCNIFLDNKKTFLFFFDIIKSDIKNLINDLKCNCKPKHKLYDFLKTFKDEKYKQIDSKDFFWILDFWRNIILSSKEAFCDSFIIDILNIGISDYFKIIKDSLFKKENGDYITDIISEPKLTYDVSLTLNEKVNFQSLEFRILLMLKYFYNNERSNHEFTKWVNDKMDQLPKNDENCESFNNYINKIISCVSLYQYIGFMYDISFENKNKTLFIDQNAELVNNLRSAINDKPDCNIYLSTIQKFKHCSLPQYKQINKNYNNVRCTMKIEKWDVAHISSFNEYISEIIKIINKNKDSNKLWFRGVCNHKYNLEPSLFRAINKNLSLYSNQANIIKKAYESTLEYSNIWKSTIIERMVLLQHYGMSTNLLDFTFNIFSALHFAINPDDQKDMDALNNGEYMPVIYAFNPIEYNKAISFLKTEIPSDKNYSYSPIICDIDNYDLSKFFVNNMTYDYLSEHTRIYNNKYVPNNRTDDYPMPIIVQQSNKRIQAQNGSFLAFSLNAQPEIINDNLSYTYLALNKIQDRYQKELFKKKCEGKDFLYRIYIHPNAVTELRNNLKKINISTGKMYPEYSKIFSEAMKEYKDQLN